MCARESSRRCSRARRLTITVRFLSYRSDRDAQSSPARLRPAVMANLTRNYSPHLKPDVETAPPTMELRAMLGTTARDCLSSYLTKWRRARKEGRAALNGANDSRKVDMVSGPLFLLFTLRADPLFRRSSTQHSFASSPKKGARPTSSCFSPSPTTASSSKSSLHFSRPVCIRS
jgi:hypothetical protein